MSFRVVDERVIAVITVAQVGQIVQFSFFLLFLDLVSRSPVLSLEFSGEGFQLKRKQFSFSPILNG